MKAHFFLMFSAFLLSVACGDAGTAEKEKIVQPPLPFSEVATGLPLTSGPLSDYLTFSRDIAADQIATLRQDLKLIDTWDGKMTLAESQKLKDLLELRTVNPVEIGLWFKARMKYILRSDLARYQLGLVFASQNQVGLQELGIREKTDEFNTGGGNIGTAIYQTTLDEQSTRRSLAYLIIRINDKWVPILSPRVGLMRIGPALFDPDFQVNHVNLRALSNSLQRLEVLFHEARHSDGNQASGSLGFSHIICPDDGTVAPELVGVPACDNSSNGAYSVGAALLKSLLHLCEKQCSPTEREILNSIYLDRISRIAVKGGGLKVLDPNAETGFNSIDISDFQAIQLR